MRKGQCNGCVSESTPLEEVVLTGRFSMANFPPFPAPETEKHSKATGLQQQVNPMPWLWLIRKIIFKLAIS